MATRIYVSLRFTSDSFGVSPPDNLYENGSGQTSFTLFPYTWQSASSGYLSEVGPTYSLLLTGSGSTMSFEASPTGFGHGFEVLLEGAPDPIPGEQRTYDITATMDAGTSCSTRYTYIVSQSGF